MKTIKLSILTIALALLAFSCTEDEPIVIPVVEVPTSDVVVDADNVYPNQVTYFFADKYWHIASSSTGYFATKGESRLYSSEDGITWIDETANSTFGMETLAASTFHDVVVLDGKLYLIAPVLYTDFGWTSYSDASTNVYSSTDGLTFTLTTEELPTKGGAYDIYNLDGTLIISNGSLVSYGSLYTGSIEQGASFYAPVLASLPIVTSIDGSTWTAETDTLSEMYARYAATVEHEGTLYQIGGQKSTYVVDTTIVGEDTTITATCLSADVWSSTDGTNWTVAENALPTARFGASAVSFGGKIWLIGGQTAIDETTEEILVSTDGVSWSVDTQISLPAEYKGRAGHSVVVNEDELLIVGGYYAESDSTNTNMNDVWSVDISTIN